MRRSGLVLIFLFWAFSSVAQHFPMLHYTFEDGLPSNTVYQIYRDSKGFLWIGTDNGVARYNGITFEVFTSFDGLPDDEIYFFREDYQGRLWMATSNGKLCFYKNDTFHTALNTPYLKLPFDLPHISIISIEKDSSVSISPYDPSKLINIKDCELKVISINKASIPNVINDYIYKRKVAPDKYIVYGRDCVYTLDTLYNYHVLQVKKFDTNLRANFSQDQEYMFNENYLYNDEMKVIHSFKNNLFKKTRVYNYHFSDSNLFACTKDGLFLNDTRHIIKNVSVSSITQDNIGNFWIGTLNQGVFCFRNDFLNTRFHKDAYNNKVFYCKAMKNNVFYATSDNNLFVIDSSYNNRMIFDYRKFIGKNYSIPNDAGYLLSDDHSYHNFYNNDYLTIDNVLEKNYKVKRYVHNLTPLGIKKIILADSQAYLRTINDIVAVNVHCLQNGDNINSQHFLDPFKFVKTYCMAIDANNNVWYSTIQNFFLIRNGQAIAQSQFKKSFKNFDFLGKYVVGCTFDNKLLLIDNIYGPINIDTIPSENCVWNKLYKLNDSILLISTNNLDRILTIHSSNTKNKYSLSVLEDPFVPLNIESICSDGSNCYFFKDGSITVMSISSLLKKSIPPKLFFSLFKAGKRQYSITREIEIAYNESRNISVSFSTHSFSGKNISYLYSVTKNGVDNWLPIKSEEINMINPTYGSYNIKVRAKTMNSDYSAPIIFTLHILRPYWATWWFVSLCVLASIVLAGVVIRIRIFYVVKKNKKKHELEMKFVKSEYKALNALMNPHFIFNTLNNVQGLFNANDKLAANEYLRIFADLIRQNMHNVSKELIPLQREIALVMNYLMLEKLRFEDKLNYIINVDDDIDTSEFMVPPLLIQPLVENSIKHGILPMKELGGTVIVNVFEADNMLCIEVKDNGVGINHTKKESGIMHESFGMENIKKRIEQLSVIQNKEITFDIREINDEAGNHIWTISTIRMHT
jgi:hypothetical protein